jgi:Zn-dependent protease with chaperone function
VSSARRLYRLHLALGLLGTGVVLAALVVAGTRIRPGLPSGGELLEACQRIVPLEPGLGLLVVLALLSLATAAALLAARSLWRQVRDQRRFLRGLARVGEARIGGASASVIESPRPQAFCAGLLRPRVYISTAALRLLTPSELSAVLAHESHHRARRDPLRILAARVFADALFFLPALGRLSRRYHQLAELAADDAAARSWGASALASALLRFGERGEEAMPVVGIAPERVEHLLGQAPRWQLPFSLLSGSLVILAALFALVLTTPALTESESFGLAAILAESCMVTMVVVPVGMAIGGIWVSRGWLRRRLTYR